MVHVGRYNTLTVVRQSGGGFLLGEADRPVFLPAQQAPDDIEVGRALRVFVYTDSEANLIASTDRPRAVVGEFAFLECVQVSQHGAFLDWGMPKDLFVPFAEQHHRMVEGRSYVVIVCLDKHVDRAMASSKLGPFFDYDLDDLVIGDPQDLLVFAHNDVGAQVVVDQRYVGLVYTDATFRELPIGSELTGYIAGLRADNRIDIALSRPEPVADSGQLTDAQETILTALRRAQGFLPIHDGSDPREIQQLLGLSKTVFKRSAGGLYKARLIRIEDDGLHLLE